MTSYVSNIALNTQAPFANTRRGTHEAAAAQEKLVGRVWKIEIRHFVLRAQGRRPLNCAGLLRCECGSGGPVRRRVRACNGLRHRPRLVRNHVRTRTGVRDWLP
jgi:hypothetical protein